MSIQVRKTADGRTRYLARVKVGEVHVASRTFGRKSDAERWEREQRHRFETGRPIAPKPNYTLAQLVETFQESRRHGNPKTIDTDNNNLAALPPALLRRPLTSIQAEDIQGHLLSELRSGKAPSTVARARTTLSALFTYAEERGMLEHPHPVRTMKKLPQLSSVALRSLSLSEIPTGEQIDTVLSALRERRADIADVFEFMSLTGIRWGEIRALRVRNLSEHGLPQLNVERSHSDRYEEKVPKSWRGLRSIPLSPRGLEIFRSHAAGKRPGDYTFTNTQGGQLTSLLVRKFPLGFRRHALRHFAASTWLRLGTPVHEVAEYLGDDPRTVLAVYAHVLGEGQRRDFAQRLAKAEHRTQTPAPEQPANITWLSNPSGIPHGRDGIGL
ncbi:tyrosine-type recombinase/integrase [Microbacterium sp. GXF0217]